MEDEATIRDLRQSLERMTEERDALREAYKNMFRVANHAFCYNNFKFLKDYMPEHQDVAKQLGIYP